MAAGNERSKREKRLFEASMEGSVKSLKQMLLEDPLALARVAVTCFAATPLHIAAMLGYLDFVKFIVAQKANMAAAADLQGRSPLHLAAANGYVEIVNVLVSVNPNVCLVKDEDGRTPLHLAVMKGQAEVISKLAHSLPEVVRDRLDQGQNLVHLAVKQNRFGALQLILQLGTEDDLGNAKDDHGNTIFQIAAGLKQLETIKYLVDKTGAKVNAVNGNGLTALDIIKYTPRDLTQMEIRKCLVNSGALMARKVPLSAREDQDHLRFTGESVTLETDDRPLAAATRPPEESKRRARGRGRAKAAEPPRRGSSMKIRLRSHEIWLKENRDALMIAATVIATMAYQAGLNPPSGVWGEDTHDSDRNTTIYAGTSIMASKYPGAYPKMMAYNAVSFVASLSIIFLLISGLPLKKMIFMWVLMVAMWVTLTFMALTYLISMQAISPDHELVAMTSVVRVSVLTWLGLIGVVVMAHTVRFIRWCVRKWRKLRNTNPILSIT